MDPFQVATERLREFLNNEWMFNLVNRSLLPSSVTSLRIEQSLSPYSYYLREEIPIFSSLSTIIWLIPKYLIFTN